MSALTLPVIYFQKKGEGDVVVCFKTKNPRVAE